MFPIRPLEVVTLPLLFMAHTYNCPEVWTLRRFRDNTLAGTWYGMTFIKFYYAISPKLVKWLGNTTWFKTLWRKPLDKLVNALNRKGVENTPYQD